MLTIGQLASFVGVTVKAVRHYHRIGLLPEPSRDRSGYRSYDVDAVIALTRIKVLSEAGVPLRQVARLMDADDATLKTAVDRIARDVEARIDELRERQTRVRRLTAGDGLSLPPDVVTLLDRLRTLDVPDAMITLERDGWIIWSATAPESVSTWAKSKLMLLEDPRIAAFYRRCAEIVDYDVDDPRIAEFADAWVENWTDPNEFLPADAAIDVAAIHDDNPTTIALLYARMEEISPAMARLSNIIRTRMISSAAQVI